MFEGQKTESMDRWISLLTNNPVFSVQAGSKSFQTKFLLHLVKKKPTPPRNRTSSISCNLVWALTEKHRWTRSADGTDWYVSKDGRGHEERSKYDDEIHDKRSQQKSKQGNKRLRSLCAEWISTACMLIQRERWESCRGKKLRVQFGADDLVAHSHRGGSERRLWPCCPRRWCGRPVRLCRWKQNAPWLRWPGSSLTCSLHPAGDCGGGKRVNVWVQPGHSV